MDTVKLTKKKNELDGFRPFAPELVKNLDEWFSVELTYTSNAIEGNTLTRKETAVVLEKGITVGGKSLREHLEATNHAKALSCIYSFSKQNLITEQDILNLHSMILRSIDDNNAGKYRSIPVRIAGSEVTLPSPDKVPSMMKDFVEWLEKNKDMHPVMLAAEAHFRLVTIHPFTDGNGRTARLLMNLILLQKGYPTAIIRKRHRLKYIDAIEKAQLGGSKADYEKLIEKAVLRSLDIWLKAAKNEQPESRPEPLLRIGQLAEKSKETVATIRYWTKLGLLEIADTTKSGYQLYEHEMIERVSKIRALQKQRLTLEEILKQLT
ncbi:MAG: Fic family protein [Alphaproteobacteria bacterium]|nr:Fic family protein [Alphaproteobacteria bacterium]